MHNIEREAWQISLIYVLVVIDKNALLGIPMAPQTCSNAAMAGQGKEQLAKQLPCLKAERLWMSCAGKEDVVEGGV